MNSKLVMIGDSITDCGRAHPVGEASFSGLGNGYVALVDAMLNTEYPEFRVRVVNMGISGNTVRDLRMRWQKDVIDLNPDWVSLLIGINDVWRQFDHPLIREIQVLENEFEETLNELVGLTKSYVKGITLMSPFYLEPNKEDPMRNKMDEYGRIVGQIANKYNVEFIDTQAVFDEYLKHDYTATLASDRVHPNLRGHLLIANAFVRNITG